MTMRFIGKGTSCREKELQQIIDYFEDFLLGERERVKRSVKHEKHLALISDSIQRYKKARGTFEPHPPDCECSWEGD